MIVIAFVILIAIVIAIVIVIAISIVIVIAIQISPANTAAAVGCGGSFSSKMLDTIQETSLNFEKQISAWSSLFEDKTPSACFGFEPATPALSGADCDGPTANKCMISARFN